MFEFEELDKYYEELFCFEEFDKYFDELIDNGFELPSFEEITEGFNIQ